MVARRGILPLAIIQRIQGFPFAFSDTVGWLDLSKGPDLLTIPDMGTRFHSVELVAPRTGVVIATLKAAGTTFIAGRGDATPAPGGTAAIHASGKQVLVIGRTLVYGDADLPAALALAQQITVKPLPR